MSGGIEVKRALISVSDKEGLEDLAKELSSLDIDILSTGGTKNFIEGIGVNVTDVSSVTGFPEILDGRVKTLHPNIHGGLLGIKTNKDHMETLKSNSINTIDLLIVNLYPFEDTIKKDVSFEECIENIDIGGPAMIRAAAKNHNSVAVVVDKDDYGLIIEELKKDGKVLEKTLKNLALKAYSRTAAYDSAISNWMNKQVKDGDQTYKSFGGKKIQSLRYGENPHQEAAFYTDGTNRSVVITAEQIQGKELSYNNINDTDAAFELVSEFDPNKNHAVAIIKHANPCGVAINSNQVEAYKKALKCDSTSAFGGIISFNSELQKETAELITEIFTEVIIAPSVSDEAKNIISKKKNLRLLSTGGLSDTSEISYVMKTVTGGFLVQTNDNTVINQKEVKVVSKRKPTDQELEDLYFAFTVAKHVKSNAIVYAKNGATVGIGAGQMNRLDSSRIAARKSEDAASAAGESSPLAVDSVVASDAFFPFADGLIAAAEAGVTAIIQPGGSIRDEEVIQAADDAGLGMIFTGLRHFNHYLISNDTPKLNDLSSVP